MGSPAARHAFRVTFMACMPVWPTQPPTTWPISTGSTPVRMNRSRWTAPEASQDLARLLGVEERLAGLGLHERHQREAVRPGDDDRVVRVAHHSRQLRLEDLVEDVHRPLDVDEVVH